MSIPGVMSAPRAAEVQQVFSQAQVEELIAKAKAEGERAGYQRGYAEAEDHYNPPPPPPVCPECGTECTLEHTPFEQEYPGACYTPPQTWAHCPECEHCWKVEDHDCEGMIRENTRGW